MKTRNYVARAKQSGAGRHKDQREVMSTKRLTEELTMLDEKDATIYERAEADYKKWCKGMAMPPEDRKFLQETYIEAWMRGFTYRLVNGED